MNALVVIATLVAVCWVLRLAYPPHRSEVTPEEAVAVLREQAGERRCTACLTACDHFLHPHAPDEIVMRRSRR